jgi:hypothetical protein
MPNWRILEQSNPGGTNEVMDWDLVVTLYFCCALAPTEADGRLPCPNGLAPKSASETPVMPTNRPAKMRRLKKADCEVDFFFMRICGYEVDGV